MSPFMTFCFRTSRDHASARNRLQELAQVRLYHAPPPPDVKVVRFPTALLFIRGDRAGPGAELASQIRASANYWDLDSGNHLDLLLAGWRGHGGNLVFNTRDFLNFRFQVEAASRWRYTGESDLLILNFDFDVRASQGDFSFEEVILLPIEELLRKEKIGSVDQLISDLVRFASERKSHKAESAVWEISDRIGYMKGRRAFWEGMKKALLKDFTNVYDEMRPYVVCDLRQPCTPAPPPL